MSPDYMGIIFNRTLVRNFLGEYKHTLNKKIDKLDILNINIEELKVELLQEYTIQLLEIGKPFPRDQTPKQITELEGGFKIKSYYYVAVIIPYKGIVDLFYVIPSVHTAVELPENWLIKENSIEVTFKFEELSVDKYNKRLDYFLNKLNKNIPQLNLDIQKWNYNLSSLIDKLINDRKVELEKQNSFMQSIGLKINPASTEYLIPSPVTKKKIPKAVSDVTSDVKKELIPLLKKDFYNDVKEVLYNVGKAMERKPGLYSYKGNRIIYYKKEPDLRDVFLLFLESRYDNANGVGEAFNASGRTDILLKYTRDNSNLFVAECKFWRGKGRLNPDIDQLLGYLTHRDTKTALLYFVDRHSITTAISTFKDEVIKHPNYKSFIESRYDSTFSYEFFLKTDPRITIEIEVMFFHFPKFKQ